MTIDRRRDLGVRADTVGAANHSGLVAALLLVILTAISNDRSLTWLGARRWRAAQRWAYRILALTILHGALSQVLERRRLVLVVLFVLLSDWTLAVQLAGWRHMRGRGGVR